METINHTKLCNDSVIARMLMAKIILLCCARQAKGRSIRRCPAWLLANADHVFAHAAASMHTAYFSTSLRHSNCWQKTRRPALFLILRTASKTCNSGHSLKSFPFEGPRPGGGLLWDSWKTWGGLRRSELVGEAVPHTHFCQLDFRRNQVWVPRRYFAFQNLMSASLRQASL